MYLIGCQDDSMALALGTIIEVGGKKKMTNADNKCGDCAFLVTEDGEPYYCATRDLYTLRNASDKACDEFVSKMTKQDVEAIQDLMVFKKRYKHGK